MPQHLIILLVLVPMIAGILTLLSHRSQLLQQVFGVAALLANVGVAIWALTTVLPGGEQSRVLASQLGNWPAPFGISIVVDPLSAIMMAIAAIVCFAVFIYCIFQMPPRFRGGYFHPLYHFLVFGVQWSFITGDLFNLFVAFEIMLMASYAMFCIGTTKQQMRQAYKYILLNLFASTLFVTCCGLIYGQLGTLNLADLTRLSMEGHLPPTSIPVIATLLVVFGAKTAIFPLWFWLPDSYPTLPAPLAGLFAGLLTKVGAYVLIRIFVMVFGSAIITDLQGYTTHFPVNEVLAPVLLISAGVTMFLGVLGAVSMHTVRSILSIHIISQVGYMIMGIALSLAAGVALRSQELAIAGSIFFIIHNMVVKCCLFLCGGLMEAHAGSDDLDKIGGLARRAPWLGVLFIIAALSLAGLPPLSGFFGKFILIQEGWRTEHYVLTGFAIATSLLTLMSMLKIWSYGFWSPSEGKHVEEPDVHPRTGGGLVAIALLVVVALSMGLGANSFMGMCDVAARNVVTPRAYVAAVLGENAVANLPTRDDRRSNDPTVAHASPFAPGSARGSTIVVGFEGGTTFDPPAEPGTDGGGLATATEAAP